MRSQLRLSKSAFIRESIKHALNAMSCAESGEPDRVLHLAPEARFESEGVENPTVKIPVFSDTSPVSGPNEALTEGRPEAPVKRSRSLARTTCNVLGID
jgi:hypothetical protein